MLWLEALVLAALFGFAALLAGMETGFYALNGLRVRYRASCGDKNAIRLAQVITDPAGFLGAMLLVYNIDVYLITFIATNMVTLYLTEHHSEIIATLILTVPLFTLTEIIPKNLFRRLPGVLMFQFSVPAQLVYRFFRPVARLLLKVASKVAQLVKAPPGPQKAVHLGTSLEYLLAQELPAVRMSPYQHFITRRIIGLSRRPVREIMVAWNDVAKIPESATAQELQEMTRLKGHSRLVAIDEQGDPTGTLSIFDSFFGKAGVRPPQIVETDRPVLDALYQLQKYRATMALVTDQGNPVGIVTMKDLIEEIVGELVEW